VTAITVDSDENSQPISLAVQGAVCLPAPERLSMDRKSEEDIPARPSLQTGPDTESRPGFSWNYVLRLVLTKR